MTFSIIRRICSRSVPPQLSIDAFLFRFRRIEKIIDSRNNKRIEPHTSQQDIFLFPLFLLFLPCSLSNEYYACLLKDALLSSAMTSIDERFVSVNDMYYCFPYETGTGVHRIQAIRSYCVFDEVQLIRYQVTLIFTKCDKLGLHHENDSCVVRLSGSIFCGIRRFQDCTA